MSVWCQQRPFTLPSTKATIKVLRPHGEYLNTGAAATFMTDEAAPEALYPEWLVAENLSEAVWLRLRRFTPVVADNVAYGSRPCADHFRSTYEQTFSEPSACLKGASQRHPPHHIALLFDHCGRCPRGSTERITPERVPLQWIVPGRALKMPAEALASSLERSRFVSYLAFI
jgi:hypothetical protein